MAYEGKKGIMSPMNDIKLCVFDFDGTLVDTREFILAAFEYTLRTHKLAVPDREMILRKIGKPLEVDYKAITGLEDTEKLCETHRAFQNQNQHLVALFPGSREMLIELRKQGIKIAVVTTRSKLTSLASIEQAGISKDIDIMLSIEDVVAARPNPDCILKCMDYFSVLPSETLMIGDRVIDIEAGKNAQVKTVAALYGIEGDTILRAEPDLAIHSIDEILSVLRV